MDPRTAYREAGARDTTNRIHWVVLLYEQAAHDLRRAVAAMNRKDIEARTRELDHALVVIGHLQASLDPDQGGEVARNLDFFYNTLRASLIQAQTEGSASILEEQIANLLTMRDAWIEVERVQCPAQAATPSSAAPGGVRENPGSPSESEWSA